MSEQDHERWERRYSEGSYAARTYPSALLEQWLSRLPPGRALDVACGAGRNAVHLARAGFTVDAVDISGTALARGRERAESEGLTVNWVRADLDGDPLPGDAYQLVSVFRYLDRNLVPRLIEALDEGGRLLYETHLQTGAEVDGPRNPAFRLRPGELLHLCAPLRVLHYREALIVERDGRRMAVAQLVACRGGAGF